MSDQINVKFDKKNYISPVSYKFDLKTKNMLSEIFDKKTDPENAKRCIDHLEDEAGIYWTITQQIRKEETSIEVEKIIKKNRTNVKNLISSLEKLSESDESLNRLHILIPAYKSHEDRINTLLNRDDKPLPNPVREMFVEITESLNLLDQRLNLMKLMGDQVKLKGRPPKHQLKYYVRKIYSIYDYYLGKPNLTRQGEFETVVEICLEACGEPKSDFHQLIRDSREA